MLAFLFSIESFISPTIYIPLFQNLQQDFHNTYVICVGNRENYKQHNFQYRVLTIFAFA